MENFLFNLLLMMECLFLMIINKLNNYPIFSIVQLQNCIWFFAFLIYFSNVLGYYPLQVDVYICAFFYLLFFNIGTWVIYSLKSHRNYNINIVEFISSKWKRNKCIYFSIVAYFISIPILSKSIPILINNNLSKGMNLLRYQTYNTEYTIFTTIDQILMSYIIRPIFMVTIILLAEQVSIRKINLKLFIIAIIDAFMLILMTAGRSMLVSLITYIVCAVFVMNGIKIKKIILRYKKYMLPAVGLFFIIVFVSSQRINRDNNSVVEILIYYFSGLPYFSELIKNNMIQPFILNGQALFAAIVDPFALIFRYFNIHLLGINANLASQIISHLTNSVISVAPNIEINAVGSTLLAFYLDFGIWGMIFSGLLLGIFSRYYEKKFFKNFNTLNFGRYLLILVAIINSIQNYELGNMAFLSTWIFMKLLL